MTIHSILRIANPDFELIVVDQSDEEAVSDVVEPFRADPRLRYLRTATRGKTKALNIALTEARSDILAITDDDCEVPAHWLETALQIFEENPRIAVTFFRVEAAPHDAAQGFIPTFHREGSRLISTIQEKGLSNGLGAGMTVRRSVCQQMGGFDAMLGVGGIFPAHEEGDLALRALLHGYQVYETDRVTILHHGFRTWKQGSGLALRNYYGTGGGLAKFVRCRQWAILPLIFTVLWRTVFVTLIESLLRLKKPAVFKRIVGFSRGFWHGLRTDADPQTLLFRMPEVTNEKGVAAPAEQPS